MEGASEGDDWRTLWVGREISDTEPEVELVNADWSEDVIWIELMSVSWIFPCLKVVCLVEKSKICRCPNFRPSSNSLRSCVSAVETMDQSAICPYLSFSFWPSGFQL